LVCRRADHLTKGRLRSACPTALDPPSVPVIPGSVASARSSRALVSSALGASAGWVRFTSGRVSPLGGRPVPQDAPARCSRTAHLPPCFISWVPAPRAIRQDGDIGTTSQTRNRSCGSALVGASYFDLVLVCSPRRAPDAGGPLLRCGAFDTPKSCSTTPRRPRTPPLLGGISASEPKIGAASRDRTAARCYGRAPLPGFGRTPAHSSRQALACGRFLNPAARLRGLRHTTRC